MKEKLNLQLKDNQWPMTFIDHDRQIVRAIVVDENEMFYFVRVDRDDEFGKACYIETAGGGVEDGEDYECAIKRELVEELGVQVEVLNEIGDVSDYYNQIHRHNINHYYLCRIKEFANKSLTVDEIEKYHLETVILSYQEALNAYKENMNTKIGSLVGEREIPVLLKAQEILNELKK